MADFRPDRLLGRLGQAGVDYIVVGGVAAQAHGASYFTGDLDVCYATDPANLERLGEALIALGARLRGVADAVPFVPDSRTLRHTRILTLDTRDGPLDLLAEPLGSPEYGRLAERALKVEWAGTTIKVAALEDLIAMKRATGRPKDLLVLEELEAIQRILRERSASP
jgi:hypothetical protein